MNPGNRRILPRFQTLLPPTAQHRGGYFWVVTAANGSYSIPGIPTSDFGIEVDARSFGFLSECYENDVSCEFPARVSVIAPNDTPGIDFTLELSSSVAATTPDPGRVSPTEFDPRSVTTASRSEDYRNDALQRERSYHGRRGDRRECLAIAHSKLDERTALISFSFESPSSTPVAEDIIRLSELKARVLESSRC